MPVGRYFVFVGGVLLALLFLADRYLPEKSGPSARADIDRSVIRVHTRHSWPEAVVYDASLPTIVPPVVAASASSERPAREAFAQLPSAPPAARLRAAERSPKSVAVKRAARSRPLANRVANYQGPRGLFDVGW